MSGAQAEPANLRRADVDVIGARQIAVLRAAQEPEPVGQDLEHALAVHHPGLVDALLEYLEDQVLLLQTAVVFEALS
jgi:hypothetical protein